MTQIRPTPRMTPAQNREKPGVEPGFTAIPNRTAEGLSAWPFSLASLKLYLYLCRQSWGWRNKATRTCYCRKCIAQATNMHVSTVSAALTQLEKAGLVGFRSDGRIDLELKGPEAYRAKVPRCPEHTSLKYEQPGVVAKRRRRCRDSATQQSPNGDRKDVHSDASSSVASAEKKLLKKEKEIRTSPPTAGAFQINQSQVPNRLGTDEKMVGCVRSLHAPFSFASRTIRDGRSAIANPKVVPGSMPGRAVRAKSARTLRTSTDHNLLDARERHDPRFREVAVAWIRKCPHEPERAGSVDSWTGRLIQIAERLNVSPHILIRCVPDDAASPRGYVRGFESGAYPLPAWTEDPAHRQTFYDWLDSTSLSPGGAKDHSPRRRRSCAKSNGQAVGIRARLIGSPGGATEPAGAPSY